MTRSCAPVSPKERPFRNGLRRLPSPRCLPPTLGPLHARFTGRETGLYQEELVEDQAPHRRL